MKKMKKKKKTLKFGTPIKEREREESEWVGVIIM